MYHMLTLSNKMQSHCTRTKRQNKDLFVPLHMPRGSGFAMFWGPSIVIQNQSLRRSNCVHGWSPFKEGLSRIGRENRLL